jgi:hypothetical protein
MLAPLFLEASYVEKIFESLLPGLPPWLVPPGAIMLLFLIAWPALREIWTGVIPSYRRYAREKRRLELLKLYYEVEAIKKDHQLSELLPVSSETLTATVQTTRHVADETAARVHEKELVTLSRWRKFLFGALGGGTISLIGTLLSRDYFFITTQLDFDLAFILLPAMLSKLIFLSLVGGVTVLATKPKTPPDAFIRGMAVPLLILLLLSFSNWYLP